MSRTFLEKILKDSKLPQATLEKNLALIKQNDDITDETVMVLTKQDLIDYGFTAVVAAYIVAKCKEEKALQVTATATAELRLSSSASSDQIVCQAIQIVNRVLETNRFKEVYRAMYQSDTAAKFFKEISVEFSYRDPTAKGIHALAWLYRDPLAKTIYLHQYFLTRITNVLDDLNNQVQLRYSPASRREILLEEKEAIIFLFAYLIIHELGHLMVRWRTGQINTPPGKYVDSDGSSEAGAFLTTQLFSRELRVLIPSSPGKFEDGVKIDGLCIENTRYDPKIEGSVQFIRVHHDYIKQVVSGEISLDSLLIVMYDNKNPVLTTRNTAMRAFFHSQCDEEGDNESVLCSKTFQATSEAESSVPANHFVITKLCAFELGQI